MPTKKKPTLSRYNRQILGFIPAYREATGESGDDLHAVAKWAFDNGLWEPQRKMRPEQILARDLARASSQDYTTDDDGEPVRKRHSYYDGERQLRLWVEIDRATPEQMRLSAQERRRGAQSDVLQIERDLRYYNSRHNPGDPIQMSFNFDQDIMEMYLPDDYPDAPPEEEDDSPPSSPV